MKRSIWIALLTLGCASTEGSMSVQEAPEQQGMSQAAATEQHAWLKQLVGTWKVSSEMPGAPGAEPMRMESTETVRMLGDLWILKESDADIGGQPFQAVMTIGYEPRKQAFSGTWVDSMHPILWVYEGSLDAAGRRLTLEAEGPSFFDERPSVRYRDSIEILGPDRIALISEAQQPDGTWNLFVRAEGRRVE